MGTAVSSHSGHLSVLFEPDDGREIGLEQAMHLVGNRGEHDLGLVLIGDQHRHPLQRGLLLRQPCEA
jgi:hypothetical protein